MFLDLTGNSVIIDDGGLQEIGCECALLVMKFMSVSVATEHVTLVFVLAISCAT